MLVLSRHLSERIMIGDDVIIQVVELRGDKCRLGIDAPKGIRVDREEVRAAVERENRRAIDESMRIERKGGVR